jgi:tetratricopeptide (TPR) repeat protein
MRQVQSEMRRAVATGAAKLRLCRWAWFILLLATGLMVSSCGNDDEGDKGGGGGGPVEPEYTAQELNEMGWASFAVGDYYDAGSYFSESVVKDATLYEAFLGLGWAQAYTGNHDDAAATFQSLIAGGHFANDARAGLAAAALFFDPAGARAAAQAVLTAEPDYQFSRRTTFDYRDLSVILAEAYFMEQNYDSAQDTIDAVAQAEGLPPSGLDPAHSETWVVADVTYASYTAALAEVIGNLSLLLASHVPG